MIWDFWMQSWDPVDVSAFVSCILVPKSFQSSRCWRRGQKQEPGQAEGWQLVMTAWANSPAFAALVRRQSENEEIGDSVWDKSSPTPWMSSGIRVGSQIFQKCPLHKCELQCYGFESWKWKLSHVSMWSRSACRPASALTQKTWFTLCLHSVDRLISVWELYFRVPIVPLYCSPGDNWPAGKPNLSSRFSIFHQRIGDCLVFPPSIPLFPFWKALK